MTSTIPSMLAAALICASPGVVDGDTLRCADGTRIRAIISDHYKSSTGFDHEVTDATTLADLNYDSLDLIEVTMAIEDEFDVELEDAHVFGLRTVSDLIAYVAGVLGIGEAEAA